MAEMTHEESFDRHILLSLRRIIRAVDIYSCKLRSTYKITSPQLICLLKIVEEGPLNSTWLGRNLHIGPSTLVGILDRLEQKGLISRHRNSRDRRMWDLVATDQGRELASMAPSPLQDELVESLRRLPKLEQASIALSLDRVADLMEARHIETTEVFEKQAESLPEEAGDLERK